MSFSIGEADQTHAQALRLLRECAPSLQRPCAFVLFAVREDLDVPGQLQASKVGCAPAGATHLRFVLMGEAHQFALNMAEQLDAEEERDWGGDDQDG